MKYSSTIVLLYFLIGCSSNDIDLTERINYWQKELTENLAIGDSQEKVEAWAADRSVTFSKDENTNELVSIVETIPSSSLVCVEWHIIVTIKIGKSENYLGNEVTSAGTCL